MTPPPTDEFEKLLLLREEACDECWNTQTETAFHKAAHAALGPEGCVTRELELLEAARDSFKKDFGDAMDWMREARAERDAPKDEVKRLKVELEHAKTCAANYDGIAHRLRVERDALREEVERQRWVFGELDSLKNELAKLKP